MTRCWTNITRWTATDRFDQTDRWTKPPHRVQGERKTFCDSRFDQTGRWTDTSRPTLTGRWYTCSEREPDDPYDRDWPGHRLQGNVDCFDVAKISTSFGPWGEQVLVNYTRLNPSGIRWNGAETNYGTFQQVFGWDGYIARMSDPYVMNNFHRCCSLFHYDNSNYFAYGGGCYILTRPLLERMATLDVEMTGGGSPTKGSNGTFVTTSVWWSQWSANSHSFQIGMVTATPGFIWSPHGASGGSNSHERGMWHVHGAGVKLLHQGEIFTWTYNYFKNDTRQMYWRPIGVTLKSDYPRRTVDAAWGLHPNNLIFRRFNTLCTGQINTSGVTWGPEIVTTTPSALYHESEFSNRVWGIFGTVSIGRFRFPTNPIQWEIPVTQVFNYSAQRKLLIHNNNVYYFNRTGAANQVAGQYQPYTLYVKVFPRS